jgi:hypothetical protein
MFDEHISHTFSQHFSARGKSPSENIIQAQKAELFVKQLIDEPLTSKKSTNLFSFTMM